MGGSAQYRYSKKIANAKLNGASDEEIAEMERKKQEAIAREKARRAERLAQTVTTKSQYSGRPALVSRGAELLYSGNSWGGSSGRKFESELAPEGKGLVGALTNKKRNEQTDQFSKDKITRISEKIYDNLSEDKKKWAINDGEVSMRVDEKTKEVTFVMPETITDREGKPYKTIRSGYGIMEGDVKNLGLDNDYSTRGLSGKGLGDFSSGYGLARTITARLKQKFGGKYTISLEKADWGSRRAAFVIKDENGKERRVFYEHNPYQDTKKIEDWVDRQF